MNKRLTKSKKEEHIVGGVCGGIAEYFDIDPALVRIAFVLTAFVSFGAMLYFACWISMPEHSTDKKE